MYPPTCRRNRKCQLSVFQSYFIVYKASSLLGRWTVGREDGWRTGGVNCGGEKLTLIN